jgi:hypothetical protein
MRGRAWIAVILYGEPSKQYQSGFSGLKIESGMVNAGNCDKKITTNRMAIPVPKLNDAVRI